MLKRKMFRDLKQNFSSFFTIFLMVLLGVLVFAGVHAYMDGMVQSADDYYRDYNLQELWVTSKNVTDDMLEDIRKVDGVKNTERALEIITKVNGFENLEFQTNFLESNEISKMYVTEGEEFCDEAGYVWIDPYCAEMNEIKVGDELTLSYGNYNIDVKVKGLVQTPDHVCFLKDASSLVPDYKNFGAAYLSMKSFPMPFTIYSQAYVDMEDGADIDKAKASLQAIEGVIAVTGREVNESYAEYQSEADEGQTYSVIFTALFLIIAILSVVSTMHRFVKKQRTQVGTMKALGISKGKILLHYISYGFGISVVAAALGVMLGRLCIGNLFIGMMKDFFQMPGLSVTTLPIVYEVTIAIVLVVTIATYLTCRKILAEPASEAIRVEVPKIKTREAAGESKFARKLSIGTRWNIRDVKRNFGRTITGIAGILGCATLVVGAFGMKNTMDFFVDWQFEKLYDFSYKLDLEETITDEQLGNLYERFGKATSENFGVEMFDETGKSYTYSLTVNDAEGLLNFSDHKANNVKLEEGLYVSEKVLSILNLKVGDTVSYRIYGLDGEYKEKIVGSFRAPQGQGIAMTRAHVEKLGIKYRPDSLYTNEKVDNNEKIESVASITDKEKMKNGMLSMLEMMNVLIILLSVVSVILGIVIIYNLGIMSFTEKQYQFATMKVLGFTSKKIKSIYIQQNIWISLIGIALGLPTGYKLTAIIYEKAIGDNFDMLVYINPLTYICSAVFVFLFSYFVNKLLSGKIKTIDMVSSLKMNE